jgi:tetratricopeptide (TPR) repeat protein
VVAPTRRALPLASGRVAAAAAAAAAAIATHWALGGDVRAREVVLLVIASILLLGTILAGVRVRVVVVLAGISGAIALPIAIGSPPEDLATSLGLATVPVLFFVGYTLLYWLSPSERSLRAELTIWLLAAPLALLWAPLAVLGLRSLLERGFRVPLVAAGAAIVVTWLAAEMSQNAALSIASLFGAMRDAAFRALMVAVGAAAALWTGARAEARFHALSFATPFESLAPTVGSVLAVVIGMACVIVAWRLPSRLAVARLRGRIDGRAAAEPLFFFAFTGCAVLVAVWNDPTWPGRPSWVALAAGVAYAWCRVRYGAPEATPNTPLWMILLGDKHDANELSNVATAWQVGQVTLLAAPGRLDDSAGDHVHAAASAGEATALLPMRAVHLEDWDDAQPRVWKAMPVRELYAAGDLWGTILSTRIDTEARIVAVARRPSEPAESEQPAEDATPSRGAAFSALLRGILAWVRTTASREEAAEAPANQGADLDRLTRGAVTSLRRSVKGDEIVGYVIPRSNAPGLLPNPSEQELERIRSEVIVGEKPLLERIGTLQPAPQPVVVRHMVLQCAPGDAALAVRIAQRLHGARDSEGRIIEAWLSTPAGPGGLWTLSTVSVGILRNTFVLVTRLQEGMTTSSLHRVMLAAFRLMVRHQATTEFDLVVVESAEPAPVPGFSERLLSTGLERRVISRLVAVRSAAAEASGFLAYPPSRYAGQVRVPAGKALEVAAAAVADRLLALDVIPIDARSVVQRPEPSPVPAVQQPKRASARLVPRLVIGGVLLAAAGVVWAVWPPSSPPPIVTATPPTPLQRALDLRNRRNYAGAIAVLTTALEGGETTSRAAMLRDRAYCYKLLGQWRASIADLSTALTLDTGPNAVSMLSDRAFGYVNVRDLDAAIADYQALASRAPRDPAVGMVGALRDAITSSSSRNGPLFLFLPVGPENSPAVIPPEAIRLGYRGFINLRFWWHTPYPEEVRYTSAADAAQATEIVRILRAAGIENIGGPTLLSTDIPRSRRIEVWLMRRAGTPPRTRPAIVR